MVCEVGETRTRNVVRNQQADEHLANHTNFYNIR
jgi:hypothetical protein